MNEYERGGIDALVRAYRDARGRYYEGDAYDFRVSTLIEVAERVAALGSFADASVVHELNVEYGDAPEAWAGLVQLRLVEALEADGVEAMMARYRSSKEALPAHAFHAGTVDPLAWTLYRSDRVEPALALFEANFAEYPESFAANESMAYVAFDQGDEESGLGIARGWLEAHPEHEAGRQLLTELERRR
jgi:hypothetical protein